MLSGGAWLFQIAGLCGIPAASCGLIWIVIKMVPIFSDPAGIMHVSDPLPILAVSALLSLLISLPFMLLLDSASDAVLYCYAYEERRKPEEKQEGPDEVVQRASCWGNGCTNWFG